MASTWSMTLFTMWLGYSFDVNIVKYEADHNRSTRANERHRDQDNNTQKKVQRYNIFYMETLKGKNHESPLTPSNDYRRRNTQQETLRQQS